MSPNYCTEDDRSIMPALEKALASFGNTLSQQDVPYLRILAPAREKQSEGVATAPSLPMHSSREAWVAEMKRLIDVGKNLKLALLVTAAKADLAYGEWTTIWTSEDKPFAKGKADKLFYIGRNLGLLDAPDRERLPLSVGALYAVAHLPLDNILMHIADGHIYRTMKVEEADALLGKTSGNPEIINTPSPLKLPRWLSRIHRLFDLLVDATPVIQRVALTQVQARIDSLVTAA